MIRYSCSDLLHYIIPALFSHYEDNQYQCIILIYQQLFMQAEHIRHNVFFVLLSTVLWQSTLFTAFSGSGVSNSSNLQLQFHRNAKDVFSLNSLQRGFASQYLVQFVPFWFSIIISKMFLLHFQLGTWWGTCNEASLCVRPNSKVCKTEDQFWAKGYDLELFCLTCIGCWGKSKSPKYVFYNYTLNKLTL